MKDDLKIAFVFVGTIVGAGLASGQEILQFFGLYGIKGFLGILLCGVMYIILSIVIVNLCFKHKYKSYRDIVEAVFGKKFGWLVDLLLTFFIFGGNTIMLSGGGAMLKEYIGIDRFWGIILMSVLAFLVAAFSTKGIIITNAAIVPLSTTVILILGLIVILSTKSDTSIRLQLLSVPNVKDGWLISSILYSSFNLIVATGVICPIVAGSKIKKHFINGCVIGSILLTILALVINFSILMYYPKSFYNEIPNLFIAKGFGYILPLVITIVIWLEMFSTEIGNLYSLSKRFEYSLKIPYTISLLAVILFSIPVSFIGFSNLIKLLYPPFGAISLVFLVGCIYKYFYKDAKDKKRSPRQKGS
ncbi:MAG: transporter [Clostridiales bacterium]|nr:transporter [Clostridiales bacterium]